MTPSSNEHAQHLDLGFEIPFSANQNQGSLGKWLIPRLVQG